MTSWVPAMKGKFGNTEFFLIQMKASELSKPPSPAVINGIKAFFPDCPSSLKMFEIIDIALLS